MVYLCLLTILLADVGTGPSPAPVRTPHHHAGAIPLIAARIAATVAPVQAQSLPPLQNPKKPAGDQVPPAEEAASDEDPTDVLVRLRDQVLAHGRGIPNHTCVETIQRDHYEPNAGRAVKACDTLLARRKQTPYFMQLHLDRTDRLRLDVSLSYEGEIYSWAGAGRFEEGDIVALVPDGAIGTGPFASLLLGVFEARSPRFVFEGDATREGRRLMEYSFSVPQEESHYRINAHNGWVIAGYTGTLLVDPLTAELVRMDVRTEELPQETNLCEVDTTMEYGMVALGGGGYLLPTATHQRFIGHDGAEAENNITFASCREFKGEAKLTFEQRQPANGSAPSRAAATIALPARVPLTVELTTTIRGDQAAAGDRIEGRLLKAIRDAGQKATLAPEGALVVGRLMRVETRMSPVQDLTIALRWETLEVNGIKIPLSLVPNRLIGNPKTERRGGLRQRGVEIELPLPGESRYGVYHFPGERMESGFRTEWLTGER